MEIYKQANKTETIVSGLIKYLRTRSTRSTRIMTSEDVTPKPFFQMGDKVIQPSQQRPLGAFQPVISEPWDTSGVFSTPCEANAFSFT